jgi:hypothetical protein
MWIPTGVHPWCRVLLLGTCLPLIAACGDDDSGPDDEQTGASLQGTVIAFEAGQAAVVPARIAAVGTPGVRVSIGSKSVETSIAGNFIISDIAIGDQEVTFSKDDASGIYLLSDIEPGEAFLLDQVQYSGGQVMTKHTGTWVGTADSNDPDSQALIDVELVIGGSGNSITGTANASPETGTWTLDGTETGFDMEGTLTLVVSESACSADMWIEGTFLADTLTGTFTEVNPPAGCGPVESGPFRLVKQ